jgi:hypothetical protein
VLLIEREGLLFQSVAERELQRKKLLLAKTVLDSAEDRSLEMESYEFVE